MRAGVAALLAELELAELYAAAFEKVGFDDAALAQLGEEAKRIAPRLGITVCPQIAEGTPAPWTSCAPSLAQGSRS